MECHEARDCPIATRCIGSAGAGVCTLDVEDHCTTSICPSPLLCVADQCRTPCTTTADCLAGACEGTSCAEPISGVDAGIDGASPDGGSGDGGSGDAAQDDAGGIDGGIDGGQVDGGQGDGGTDAGPIDDAGDVDAGPCTGAACAGGVVISEIVGGARFYVELYARGSRDVDLSGCRLIATGGPGGATPTQVLPAGTMVASHGYWLFGVASLAITDLSPTGTFAVNQGGGSVRLVCGATTLDLVGWDTTPNFEGAPIAGSLPLSGSIERKAYGSSTAMTMSSGGVDELQGNAEDSGNNASDFVVRTVGDPQASSSAREP